MGVHGMNAGVVRISIQPMLYRERSHMPRGALIAGCPWGPGCWGEQYVGCRLVHCVVPGLGGGQAREGAVDQERDEVVI